MVALFEKVQNFLLGSEDDDTDIDTDTDEDNGSFDDTSFKKKEYERKSDNINRERASRTSSHDNVTRLYPEAKCDIVVMKPATIDDAPMIVNNVRANNVCIVNLGGVEKEKAQRLADFLGGSSYALGGSIERISNDIFVMAPNGINISGKLKELKTESSSILSWVSSR